MVEDAPQPLQVDQMAEAACGASLGDHVTTAGAEPQATAEQLLEMRAYGRRKLLCHLVDTALDVTSLAVIAFLLANPLDQHRSEDSR